MLAIYVHVPYCARKCPYCDFNVHVVRNVPERRYVDALVSELEHAHADASWRRRSAGSIFFGGGTPSLFGAPSFDRLIGAVRASFGLAADAEVSLEANPEDLCRAPLDELRALRAGGVNRLSLGAQSFDATTLATLGRMHSGADVERAMSKARDAGFGNVSCDLIFGAPGQTLESWRRDLDRLIALAPEHVSTYGLTYEEGTVLTSMRDGGRVTPASEASERAMYESAIDVLTSAGYRHYEISNFARPGCESRHNLTYWSWGDYLGLGAGAHGFLRRDPARDGAWGWRYANVRAPAEYMEMAPDARASSEALDRAMAMAEFLMLGLRRIEGFEEQRFEQTFGASLRDVAPALDALIAGGLLAHRSGRIALTREGLMLADCVTAKLADVRIE